ncbi:tRNA-splicing endonuclease subunit Sen34-like [Paramacrobiotus metropolitanus]|uniref:tRNA-splicing endonuclease subunit Sen34-like n=1 Tax=Paramacrobiotus metropolitanus TaxID=2943436 RepID=UPI0024459336|nr:tRNA-splicing endonuclease subunit Sen34-like [Paramacrobiotus metropolitanus]XP_055342995.1 tRNA-splicing endonuclease subunit Sen34-like [Paramacrobiotus metropolitanus]
MNETPQGMVQLLEREDSNSFQSQAQPANDPVESTMKKITISVGDAGTLHVWNHDDVIMMQKKYHVMGNAVGCFAKTPLQDVFTSLPVRLTSAEAAYLRDIRAARFVREAELTAAPTEAQAELFHAHRQRQYIDQVQILAQNRIAEIESKRDKIFAGKISKMRADALAKGITLPADEEEIWKIMRDELLSRPVTHDGHVKLELPLRSWRTGMQMLKLPECEFSYPESHEEKIYYAAYFKLMLAGFWTTSGVKYGGDLLLYEGDVHVKHSVCIVKIVEDSKETSLEEILRLGRVATSCHKAVLWASVDNNYDVNFTCSKWALMK